MTENSICGAANVARMAAVIPCYRVKQSILDVIAAIGPEVSRIYVVDDGCPEGTGDYVESNSGDSRVVVLRHAANQGVGAAVLSGYAAAIRDGADIIIKVDGDGQMDPALIPEFIEPILCGEADYTKGNRFYDLEKVRAMPGVRLVGNAVLSFLTKLSSGYWDLFDPTNGFTAIHTSVARLLPFEKISQRFFFETDVLFRLNTLRAVVVDVPMSARYGDEISNLNVFKVIGEFLFKNLHNFLKRIFYNYYLRDLSLASFELPIGFLMLGFGSGFGIYHWVNSAQHNAPTPVGTVMLAALPVILGLQLLLAFIGHDISSVPKRPIHKRLTQRHSPLKRD